VKKRVRRRSSAARLDYSQRLARGLHRLENHLAIVVTLHLLTEFLLDRLIKAKSPTPKRILDDSRTFTYSVKTVLVRNMALIDDGLFRNLDALRKLRNEYAHGLDVDLATQLTLPFVDAKGKPLFRRVGETARAVSDEPEVVGLEVLMKIRDATFGRLHATCTTLGVDLERGAPSGS
jgi:hypothetical protein